MPKATHIVQPILGVDADTDELLLSDKKAQWLKNCEIQLNGAPTAASSGVITPYRSLFTDFPTSLLPRTKTYQISFQGTSYPFYSYAYSKDGKEFIIDTIFNNDLQLDIFFNGLGFTKPAPKTFQITSDEIWQYFSYNLSGTRTFLFSGHIAFSVTNIGDLIGNNYCIGSYYDRKLNQFFWYNYNTLDRHNIQLFNANTGAYLTVLETPLLAFDYDSRVGNNIDLVEVNISDSQGLFLTSGRLNYWCNETRSPKKINVDRALSGEYWNNFPLNYTTDDEWLRAVKYPPDTRILVDVTQAPDTTRNFNYIQRGVFQFRTRYYEDDGEKSVYSFISDLAVPIITSCDPTSNPNFFLLSNISVGSAITREVELAYRLGNDGDWRTYQIIERRELITNPIYNYDVNTNTVEYRFFNDRTYNIVAVEVSDKNYDNHPQQAGSQEFMTNNTLAYGNLLEGYNNLALAEIQKTSIDIDYTTLPILTLFITGQIDYSFAPVNTTVQLILVHEIASSGLKVNVASYIISAGTISPLIINETINDISICDKVYLQVGAFTGTTGMAVALTTRSLQGVYANVTDPLPCGTGNFSVSDATPQVISNPASGGNHVSFDTVISDTCGTWSTTLDQHTCPHSAIPLPQLKQGGAYQFGLIYYDEALRSSFVQTWDGLDKKIREIADPTPLAGNKLHTITFNFGGVVLPDEAKYVAVCRTKNKLINRSLGLGYLQWEINDVVFYKADGIAGNPAVDAIVAVEFKLMNHPLFNANYLENTTTQYTWSDGDRVQFIQNGGFPFSTTSWFNAGEDYQLKSTDSIAFRVDYDSRLRFLVDESRVMVYTPANTAQTDIYYEISDLIPTTGVAGNNQPSVASVVLNTWDTYFIQRYVPNSDIRNLILLYEHHSAYDAKLVPSNGEDIGRLNVVNRDAKRLWIPEQVRYSLVYLPESFVNGLSSFNSDRKKLYYRQYGKVIKLNCIKNILHVIQEDNVMWSNINRQLLYSADGSAAALTAGNTILSDPNDTQGDYGCQDGETFIEKDNLMYFWDLKRGVIVEYNGQTSKPISREGLASYYLNESEYIRQNRSSGLCKIQVHAGFDPKRNKVYFTSFRSNISEYSVDFSSLFVQCTQTLTLPIMEEFPDPAWLETSFTMPCGIYDDGEATFGNFTVFKNDWMLFYVPEALVEMTADGWVTTFPNTRTDPKYISSITITIDGGDPTTYYAVASDCIQGDFTPFYIYSFNGTTYDAYIETYDDLVSFMQDRGFTAESDGSYVFTISGACDQQYTNLHWGFCGNGCIYVNDAQCTPTFDDNVLNFTAIGGGGGYVDLSEQMTIQIQGTYAWNMAGFWEGAYGFTPEYYGFIDAGLKGNYMISFKGGIPYFHNHADENGFFGFYGDNTDTQYIGVVCNAKPESVMNYYAVGYDSKRPDNYASGVRYEASIVTTSNGMTSVIPIDSFVFKESWYFSNFYLNTSTGGNYYNTGEKLKGTWLFIMLKRDNDPTLKDKYSEISKIGFFINPSAKTF